MAYIQYYQIITLKTGYSLKQKWLKVLFAAFSLCLLCSFIPSFVSAQEVSDIVSSLTESQKRELDTIQAESIELQKE